MSICGGYFHQSKLIQDLQPIDSAASEVSSSIRPAHQRSTDTQSLTSRKHCHGFRDFATMKALLPRHYREVDLEWDIDNVMGLHSYEAFIVLVRRESATLRCMMPENAACLFSWDCVNALCDRQNHSCRPDK